MALFFEDISVGDRDSFGHYEMRREEILQFASAYDPQSFHLSEEAAARTHFGGLVASGWHTGSATMRMMVDRWTEVGMQSLGGAGLDELRWLRPVRPGDVLHVETEVLETRTSASRPEMGIIRVRHDTINQAGERVMSFISNGLVKRRTS